jgi:hypothetical protein
MEDAMHRHMIEGRWTRQEFATATAMGFAGHQREFVAVLSVLRYASGG